MPNADGDWDDDGDDDGDAGGDDDDDVDDIDYVDASFIHIRMAAQNVQCSAYYEGWGRLG